MMSEQCELFKPAEVATKLGISVATLRKYSLLIEEATQNKNHYQRTKQNSRLYTTTDLADLEKLQEKSNNSEMTLKEVVQSIFEVDDVVPTKEVNGEASSPQLTELLASLQETIVTQNKAIEALKAEIDSLKETNATAVFKNEPIAEDDFFDDLPDLEAVEQAREEQAQQQFDPREQILAKARENAEKNTQASGPRTLADMQLPSEKKHWWEKFR